MSDDSRASKHPDKSLLDTERTGRKLHRRIYESAAGALLDQLELGGARGFMHFCRAVPEVLRNELSAFLRDAGFQFLSRQRQICYGNLTIAKGAVWDTERIRSFTKEIFEFWGEAFVDFARLRLQMTETNWDTFMTCKGTSSLDQALNEHDGAVLVGPHLGIWEFATQALVLNGYSVTSVARRRGETSSLDRDLQQWRQKWGQRILFMDQSPRKILRRLQDGELIGLVADQYAGRDGVFTDFFGAPTSHYSGPAVLADRAEVPVIPTYCYRNEDKTTYIVEVSDPLYPDRNLSRDERVKKLIGEIFHTFEQLIRDHPRQWLWFHRKWRSKWLPDKYLDLLKSAPYITTD